MKIPILPFNNYLVFAVLLLNIFLGNIFLMSYGAAHWHGVRVPGVIMKMSETVRENERELISQSELLEKYFQSVVEMNSDLKGVYSNEMKRSGMLRLFCALLCLVLAVISIFCRPRKLALIVIPLAMVGFTVLSVVM